MSARALADIVYAGREVPAFPRNGVYNAILRLRTNGLDIVRESRGYVLRGRPS